MARKSARITANVKEPDKYFKKLNTKRLESYAMNPEHKYHFLAQRELSRRLPNIIKKANKEAESFNESFGVKHFDKIPESAATKHRAGLQKYDYIQRRVARIQKGVSSLSGELEGIQKALSKHYGREATAEEAYVAYSRKRSGSPYSIDAIPLDIEDGKVPELFNLSDTARNTLSNVFDELSIDNDEDNPFI